MICYVLAMGKQHLGPHVVVGYGIKIFWPGLFITSPDHLEYISAVDIFIRKLLAPSFVISISKVHVFATLNAAGFLWTRNLYLLLRPVTSRKANFEGILLLSKGNAKRRERLAEVRFVI